MSSLRLVAKFIKLNEDFDPSNVLNTLLCAMRFVLDLFLMSLDLEGTSLLVEDFCLDTGFLCHLDTFEGLNKSPLSTIANLRMIARELEIVRPCTFSSMLFSVSRLSKASTWVQTFASEFNTVCCCTFTLTKLGLVLLVVDSKFDPALQSGVSAVTSDSASELPVFSLTSLTNLLVFPVITTFNFSVTFFVVLGLATPFSVETTEAEVHSD